MFQRLRCLASCSVLAHWSKQLISDSLQNFVVGSVSGYILIVYSNVLPYNTCWFYHYRAHSLLPQDVLLEAVGKEGAAKKGMQFGFVCKPGALCVSINGKDAGTIKRCGVSVSVHASRACCSSLLCTPIVCHLRGMRVLMPFLWIEHEVSCTPQER